MHAVTILLKIIFEAESLGETIKNVVLIVKYTKFYPF